MSTMPRTKLSPDERRALVLAALDGANKVKLAEKYGIARSWLYVLLEEALAEPEAKLEEARKEYEFRREVANRKLDSKENETKES